MAKKSMIAKANRPQKFKVREYTRCNRCGRPHSVLRKYGICRICFNVTVSNSEPYQRNVISIFISPVKIPYKNRLSFPILPYNILCRKAIYTALATSCRNSNHLQQVHRPHKFAPRHRHSQSRQIRIRRQH